MAQLKSADRYLLGDAGLEVDEQTYVEAIAGMGVVPLGSHFVFDDPTGFLEWDPFHGLFKIERMLSRPHLLEFQKDWHRLSESQGSPRLTIAESPWRSEFDPLALARVLSHPDLKAGSVFITPSTMRSDARWQWPMRIGAWSDDLQHLQLE